MKSWRTLPPALLAMFAVEIVSLVGFLAYDLSISPEDYSARASLTEMAVAFTTSVLGLAGFLELARRATGRIALGFKISALGFALAVAYQIGWQIFLFIQPHWSIEVISAVQSWTYFGLKLVTLLGVIIAATAADRRAALAGIVALLVCDPLPGLGKHMYGWVTSFKGRIVLFELLEGFALLAVVAIAARLATPGTPSPARQASYGLRTIASGLWLRVIAACTVTGLTLLLVLGKADQGALSVLELAMISGAIVSAISLAMVARGALGALVSDIPAVPLVTAATAALWCAGIALAQLPYTYRMLYGGDGIGRVGEINRDYMDALSIVAPLVAIAAIAAVARAIAGFAARRGFEQLRGEAQSKGLGFVGLMLASIALQQWLLPKAISDGGIAFMMLGAAVCSLYATVLMARLCSLAADSLQAEPGLPTATLQP